MLSNISNVASWSPWWTASWGSCGTSCGRWRGWAGTGATPGTAARTETTRTRTQRAAAARTGRGTTTRPSADSQRTQNTEMFIPSHRISPSAQITIYVETLSTGPAQQIRMLATLGEGRLGAVEPQQLSSLQNIYCLFKSFLC